MTFPEQLQAELDRLNITQAEGAAILGVSPRAIWKWLHSQEPLAITAEGALARLKKHKSHKTWLAKADALDSEIANIRQKLQAKK